MSLPGALQAGGLRTSGLRVAATAISLALSVGIGFSAVGPARAAAAADKPNIVLIHADDWSPKMRRLWSNPERTPQLARFVRAGVEFRQASGSTPLCTPGRVNMITGRWGHNTGVTTNDPGAYDPADNLSIKLKEQGYTTIFGGKFLVKMEHIATRQADVEPYAQGWDHYDLIWKRLSKTPAYFYRYLLWTRSGVVRHRAAATDHSTAVTAKRIAQHIRQAPASDPVFVEMSLFSGHRPHLPLPRFEGDSRCRSIGGWSGPGYDEGNVKDKPGWVRQLPRLRADAYPLRSACEEMLSIDWAVGRVRDALKSTGRLRDTLIIFTADNGWVMGEHRIPRGKRVPYAAPVPLAMVWPAGLGSRHRVVTEPVSNVDLAPTICALAGCDLPQADGLSLLPLMRGTTDRLERQFVYEEYLDSVGYAPGWYGLRTTRSYPSKGRWAYTEYRSGARELYDLRTDPHRLKNLARDPRYRKRVKALHRLLHTQVIRPDGVRWGQVH